MFSELKANDIVITENKDVILEYLEKENKLLNIKIMSQNEFVQNYFFSTDERALYYLVKKYHYKYDVAKMYLNNLLFNEELLQELEKENLLLKNPLFKARITRIVLFDLQVEPFLMKQIKQYAYCILKSDKKNYTPKVFEFDSIQAEVTYVANSIRKLLDTVDFFKIHVVLEDKNYLPLLKRIFKFYGIPININEALNIYGTFSVQKFLALLKESRDISFALSTLHQDEIYAAIIEVCNQYVFQELDDILLYLIEEELKKKMIRPKQKQDAVSIISINDIIREEEYYFVLAFNEGVIPKIYKDEDYLSDEEKEKKGLFTSVQKNKMEKEKVKEKIQGFKNLILTYKLKFQIQDCYPSSLLESLGLKGVIEKEVLYIYSDIYNELTLASMLDDFIKYNKRHSDLGMLMSHYSPFPYLSYENQYKAIDVEGFRNYIEHKITLSYSSLDDFYRCPFRFFLAHILKLEKYEETFKTMIGNLFHFVLARAFLDDFDFETVFAEFVGDREFSFKEEFFLMKLKRELKEVIMIIQGQNQNSELVHEIYEKEVVMAKKGEIDVQFKGIIDKIKYNDFGHKKYVTVIDYKTGNGSFSLNSLYYGLSMQLPIYLYFLHQVFPEEEIEIAGFYLQKVIHEKLAFKKGKDYAVEFKKLYRLEGYSNESVEILEKNDYSYLNSQVIKGMKVSSKGFYPYTKVLNKKQMEGIVDMVDRKLNEAIEKIQNGEFSIHPKVIDNQNVGCEYCRFKAICYRKEEDLVVLKNLDYKTFLGVDESVMS